MSRVAGPRVLAPPSSRCRRVLLVVAAMLAAALLAACGGDDDEPTASTQTTTQDDGQAAALDALTAATESAETTKDFDDLLGDLADEPTRETGRRIERRARALGQQVVMAGRRAQRLPASAPGRVIIVAVDDGFARGLVDLIVVARSPASDAAARALRRAQRRLQRALRDLRRALEDIQIALDDARDARTTIESALRALLSRERRIDDRFIALDRALRQVRADDPAPAPAPAPAAPAEPTPAPAQTTPAPAQTTPVPTTPTPPPADCPEGFVPGNAAGGGSCIPAPVP